MKVNIYNLNNATLFSFEKGSNTKIKRIVSNNDIINNNQNNFNIATPKRNKIDRFYTLERLKSENKESNKYKKEGKTNILEQIIKDNHNLF